ncbi:uncharacterized protein KY384_001363 [Bacidia gigantensis]|uniref:uncharacterized protein n=1 Tax=Bacidia gigantensis TaxID=2732470 RepID=UPI001D03D31D|nr:uncharacterized protein KY384_001363 [Bacidia gigantensis]KAG8533623.1 hypothetical protein KY384_001363 [Bacidia gigantensis]
MTTVRPKYVVVLEASETTSSSAVGLILNMIESDMNKFAERVAMLTDSQISLKPYYMEYHSTSRQYTDGCSIQDKGPGQESPSAHYQSFLDISDDGSEQLGYNVGAVTSAPYLDNAPAFGSGDAAERSLAAFSGQPLVNGEPNISGEAQAMPQSLMSGRTGNDQLL